MKKTVLIVLVLLIQNVFAKGNLTETQKLAATAKVWGFLKYYHPNVAVGKINWDNQLFDILPQVEKAQSKEEFSAVIEKWITSLGEIQTINIPQDTKKIYFSKNLNLEWIGNKDLFAKSLSSKLKFIEENRFQGKQFYVGLQLTDPNVVPLEFINEVKYPDFKWTDKNLRLLTLFRYWNYIEYFFPYKYQMDEKWDVVLSEILPRFIAPESELDFHLTMRELSVKLDDTHASIGTVKMFERFGDKFIPVDVKIIDDKAIVTALKNDSLAKISDIKIGDVITKVNGKTVSDIIKGNKKYVEGSNESAVLRNFYWLIFNGNTETVEIEFIREGKTSVKNIYRYLYKNLKISYPDNEKSKNLENNIGYINMGEIGKEDVPVVMEQFKNAKAIIFDLRNNSQGTNYAVSEYLNPEPKEFVKFIDNDLSFPGRFVWREEIEKSGKTNPDYYKGKVILLVNEVTQSHGEYTAMCLQAAPHVTVIGSQTAGADGGVCRLEIIKGFRTQFTSYGIFYPNKKETQRIGIVPDIVIKPTIKGIQDGKDEPLDRAILFVNTGK
ncbi:S41 family peptidase [Flavobacterium sp. LS1R49]|uniref:S41 family peptidase n=1 Tax=Flavobacterium shii TaxID=2987687 RepID=A0A9X3BXD1_9FLAO|nr:S41 family peptidase [Flavobacterium shii]MCV9927070.1 S41 family peptidase [Flavobacterium shii]